MDSVNNWKKILLQWIKECNFLEKNFYSLDQTEIEVFFMHFKDRFKEDNCQYNNLSSFLKDQYPLFEPHFDDEDTLSSGDHIYVYSLLLHFSCVRCPVPFFQENCQKLNELAQRNIAAFFQKLLNDECLTKETLRHIIASIQLFTPPSNRFVFNAESPLKTPRKVTDISPPTPRSCMLQEKSKKVHALKAQLETLGYEKSVLETDLKLYLDKIDKLNHEVKRSNQQIEDLKNDILSKSKENGDCGIKHTGEEQIRRLSKKIALKEREIAQQKETIEDLTEQKDCLNEKLKNAEKQMKILQSSMSDLAEKVDDLSQELEQKEHTIQNLSDVKCELEQYISEIRSSTVNSRPDLNMSSEFLDYSRATNSSGSLHSPENLGSVVDIKLREKENENEQLLEEISSIRIDNKKLAKAMSELTARYSKLFDVCNENLITEDDENTTDPTNYFIIFSNCIQSFAEKYKENCFALNRMKADAKQIEEQNLSQANKLEETQKHNVELKKEIGDLLSANKLLQTSKTSLENAMTELENKLENCRKERTEEANNFKTLQKEFENLKTQKLDAEHSFQQQIENLNSCLELKENLLTQLKLDNENNVQLLINENQLKFEELYQEKLCFEKKITDFKNVEMNLLQQLDLEQSQRTYLSCELEKSKNNYDAVLIDKKHLTEKNEQQINLLQKQIKILTDDQNLKASIILKHETDTESLVDSMLDKIQNLSNAIDKYEKIFEETTSQLTELGKNLLHAEAERNSSQTKLQEVSCKLERTNKILSKTTRYTFDLVKNLKHRLGVEINETHIEPLLEPSCDIDDIERIDIKLKEEAKCLMDEIASFTMSCEYAVNENAFLRTTLAELENTIEDLNKEKSSLEKNVSHLEAKHNKQICVIDNLVKLEANLQGENKIMTSSIAELKIEILNKTNDAQTLLEKQNQADKLVKELQEKIVKLESDLTAADKKDEEHTQELRNAKVQLENEIAEKIAINEKLHKTTEEITQLKTKISFLESQLRGMKEEACNTSDEQSREFEKIEIQLNNEITEKQHLTNQLTAVRLQFENVQKEKTKITEDLENIKLQLETIINEKLKIQQLQTEATQKQQEELQTVRLYLETEFTKIQGLIADLANTKAQLQSEVTNKQKLQREFEQAKSVLENDVVTYKTNLEKSRLELEEEVVEKSKMTKDFESTKLKLESELTDKTEATQKLQEELQTITLELETEFTKNKGLLADLASTKVQLESEVKNKEQLQKEFEEARSHLENDITTYKMNVAKAQLELEEEVVEKSKMTKEFESTKLQLESEITEKIQIKENLKETKLQLEKKLTENQQIREDLQNLKLQLESKITESCKVEEDLENANKALNVLRLKVTDLETKCETQQKLIDTSKIQLENEAIANTELKETFEKASHELKELQTRIVNLETNNKGLNQKTDEYNRQLEDARHQLENEASEKFSIREALEIANKQVNERTFEKTVLEKKHQVLLIEVEKYRNQVEELQNKETCLLEEIEMLKSTSESEIKKCNKEAEEQKENVSRLIQEIASMRKEKEFAEEERSILSKRLESYLNEQTSRDTNQRSVEEKLQLAEKEVLVKLNLLKTEQLKSQDLENQLKKMQLENTKQKETAVSNMRRIEKQALALGESQANCRKLKKETEVGQNNLEILRTSLEATQRENIKLNQECKSLKEKLSKSEKSKDQLDSRTQTLLKEIENLIEEKKNLETSESELKTSNSSLEKIKHNLEDKVRKLAKSLGDLNVALNKLEQDKVQLNLEVGGLNKQLQENKTQLNMKLIEIENLTSNLIDAKNTNSQLVELNEKHQNQAKEIDEENSRLNDQLSKLSLRLEITQQEHETTKTELDQLRSAIESSKLERDAIERDHQIAVERLTGIEGIVEERRRSTEVEFVNKIKSLEMQISKLSTDNCNLEELRSKDKLMIEQLNEDILIFEAKLKKSRGICEENEKKWSEEKELLSAEVKDSEDRIKETRLELEGKLEKMKNKMKTLYNDEVTKMKKKQEREVAVFKTDIDSLKAKNEKHEAHIKKLSSQIFRLNENILEYQKENTFLKTKLNDLENKPRQLSRVRPVSSASTSAHQVLSSNLRMEDEEGEIFNNTYLSDLKDGRMSEYFNTDICAQELQYRNSLLPPHLKSTYLAQFDHQMGEDEIRDTPTLDDSSSTLLNTGQRKKVSGATSYKRPGPPTPSKNAGRLSFGGIGELNREILKESHDIASCSSSSSKTPAKFKFFSSKLSMKGDERKSYVTNFKKKLLSGGTIQCSSTPRKSKAHIDQRRLLDQIMSTASPGAELSPDCIVKPAVNLPSSLKKLELNRRVSLHKWRMPQLTYASDSGNSDVNSPQMKDRYVNGSSGSKKRTKRSKDRRGSIYLRGSMFARNCRTPTMGLREVFKKKSKIQRNANFNKFRHENLKEMLVKKASLCCDNWDETCNNNNDEFFLEDLDMKKHIIEDGDNSCGEDDVNNDKTSKHFQQLLEAKESNAPFEISEINSNPSCSHVNNSSSNVHSRIIYGASVILNRKIPNVSTTMVRKSSIYVKGHDGKSVILVTNQTITLKDLAHMWLQMNVSAKTVIGFCFVATLIVIISLIIQFIRR